MNAKGEETPTAAPAGPPRTEAEWAAYREKCRRAIEEAPGDQIDLTPEDDAILDEVWDRIGREEAEAP